MICPQSQFCQSKWITPSQRVQCGKNWGISFCFPKTSVQKSVLFLSLASTLQNAWNILTSIALTNRIRYRHFVESRELLDEHCQIGGQHPPSCRREFLVLIQSHQQWRKTHVPVESVTGALLTCRPVSSIVWLFSWDGHFTEAFSTTCIPSMSQQPLGIPSLKSSSRVR